MSSGAGVRELTAARKVSIEAIERELAQMWDEAHSITRACMSNLVIFCSTHAQADRLTSELPAIVEMHPSRVILISGRTEDVERPPEAHTSAFCYVQGGGNQICSEHIRLEGSGRSVHSLPSLARALLIGDLPTALWWADPQPPPVGTPLFEDLASLADHLIYDSRGWADALAGLRAMAAWDEKQSASSAPVVDLAWSEFEPWRRMISECLDPAVMPGALFKIRRVAVTAGPGASSQACLLGGWLAAQLDWEPRAAGEPHFSDGTGSEVHVQLERHPGDAPGLRTVSLAWPENGNAEGVRFEALDAQRLAAIPAGSGAGRSVRVVPSKPPGFLLARELSDRRRDPVFSRALRASLAMSRAIAS